jgi:hypothetical protein
VSKVDANIAAMKEKKRDNAEEYHPTTSRKIMLSRVASRRRAVCLKTSADRVRVKRGHRRNGDDGHIDKPMTLGKKRVGVTQSEVDVRGVEATNTKTRPPCQGK